jgi:hypothetical protein
VSAFLQAGYGVLVDVVRVVAVAGVGIAFGSPSAGARDRVAEFPAAAAAPDTPTQARDGSGEGLLLLVDHGSQCDPWKGWRSAELRIYNPLT